MLSVLNFWLAKLAREPKSRFLEAPKTCLNSKQIEKRFHEPGFRVQTIEIELGSAREPIFARELFEENRHTGLLIMNENTNEIKILKSLPPTYKTPTERQCIDFLC